MLDFACSPLQEDVDKNTQAVSCALGKITNASRANHTLVKLENFGQLWAGCDKTDEEDGGNHCVCAGIEIVIC